MSAPWFSIRADAGATRVMILDAIGEGGVTAERFLEQLKTISGPIALSITSVGGDFFQGMTIADELRRRGGVTAHVTLAASIASVIALSADRVVIADAGYLMTHAPFTSTTGDAAHMDRMAQTLRKLTGTLSDLYQRETKQSRTTVSKWMETETWFDAREAVKVGLADEIDGQPSPQASIDLSRFKNPPAALRALTPPTGWDRVISQKYCTARA